MAALVFGPAWATVKPTTAQSLIDQAALQISIDPEAARRDAEIALQQLAENPDPDLEIRARLLLCDYYVDRDPAAAQAQSATAATLVPHATRKGLSAGIQICQGAIAEAAGDLDHAVELSDQAVTIATDAHDNEMLARALSDRGYRQGTRAQYALSLADMRRAQALYELLNNVAQLASIKNDIALIYYKMGDYTESIRMNEVALAAERKAGLHSEEVSTLNNLGHVNEKLGDLDAARAAYNEDISLSRQYGFTMDEAYGFRGLASIAIAQHDPDTAEQLINQVVTLQGRSPDILLQARLQLLRGMAYDQKGRLQDSAAALDEAVATFRRTESLDELASAYEQSAVVHAELGDWRAAYDYGRLAQSNITRILRNQIDQRVALLKVEYDMANREKENSLLMRENIANQAAILQQGRVDHLKSIVIVLTAMLLAALVGLILHQRRSGIRMRSLAMTDELTAVPNRRALLERLGELLLDSSTPTSLLIIDIDHFKAINDRHGHPAGDETLREMARHLQAAVWPGMFGRLGGEEFAVILTDTSLDEARATAERLRDLVMHIDLRHLIGDRLLTVSIGIATAQTQGDSTSSMLLRADAALYAAKGGGRNCVRLDPLIVRDAPTLVA